MMNYLKIKGGLIMSASRAMYQKLAKLAVVRGVNVQPKPTTRYYCICTRL